MKKDRKGFTLIELLAVIVILGLLMAIAIPSVTRYITESRKKTLVSTMNNYMSALVNDVNNLTYSFAENKTIYAVPIECIAVERGGTNPLGDWLRANNNYWAYILVQYNSKSSSYRYGFTFKDSNGNGMYPTQQTKIDAKGKDIKKGLNLTKPTSGDITSIAEVDKWVGFDVDFETNLVVLEARKEGLIGDGINTCTLQQKGNNYEEVEEEKENNNNNNNDNNNSGEVNPPTSEGGDDTTDDGEQTPGDNNEKPIILDYFASGEDYAIRFTINLVNLSDSDYPLNVDFYIDNIKDGTITLNSGNEINYTYSDLEEKWLYNVKAIIKNGSGEVLGEVVDSATPSCFLAGTKVLTESGLKNIEDIKLGEMVYSLNLDNNKRELKKVTKLIRSKTSETYELTIGDNIVKATPRHEFYIVDKGWIRAKDLQEGDVVVSTSGEDMEIKKIVYKAHDEEIETYNLTIADNHNYLITEDRLLVHNAASPQ